MQLFEQLKAKRNVPVDDAFAVLFAGKYKTSEISGVPPVSFTSKGGVLEDYRISGNTVQDGTPTPEAPVDVLGCGVRTENLFDYQTMGGTIKGYYLDSNGILQKSGLSAVTEYIPCNGGKFSLAKVGGISPSICLYDSNKHFLYGRSYNTPSSSDKQTIVVNSSVNASYIRFTYFYADVPQDDLSAIMLNAGTEPLPYEPYGYKLPLTVNGTEYPIYLGQVPTTRRVKKLMLLGTENWETQRWQYRNDTALFLLWQNPASIGRMQNRPSVNTHFISAASGVNPQTQGYVCSGYHPSNDYSEYYYIRLDFKTIGITSETTTADAIVAFKSYLADQYAAGTPVTVWYALATPETGIVNEPLHKISTYADTISMEQAGVTIPAIAGTNTLLVDTTVQPSSVTIRGRIRPTL